MNKREDGPEVILRSITADEIEPANIESAFDLLDKELTDKELWNNLEEFFFRLHAL